MSERSIQIRRIYCDPSESLEEPDPQLLALCDEVEALEVERDALAAHVKRLCGAFGILGYSGQQGQWCWCGALDGRSLFGDRCSPACKAASAAFSALPADSLEARDAREAAHDARVRVEALEAAADEIEVARNGHGGMADEDEVRRWLRARAAAIRAGKENR